MTEPEGSATQMRCPYHGWTYSLEGELKGTPDFSGVCDFDRTKNSLVPLQIATWENWVFVKLAGSNALSLESFLTRQLVEELGRIELTNLHWFERRHYH